MQFPADNGANDQSQDQSVIEIGISYNCTYLDFTLAEKKLLEKLVPSLIITVNHYE